MTDMVPMIDLQKQFADIKEEILDMVTEILESAHYILGPKVTLFENKVAAYHNVAEAIGVASGTDALHLAIKALGIGKDDEVITTPFTFFATAEAVIYTGAAPVFVDIDPETMNIDPAQIEAKITKHTKAILPVHVFGHPADMDAVTAIAKKHGLHVIEDCAQSFGAEIRGRKTGSFGDAGCFSFYPSKNLGAFGDGGLVTLNDISLADRIRVLRNHGSKGAYKHETVGFNSRLDELQAGILLVKFKKIDEYNMKRRANAVLYDRYISGKVTKPVEKPGMTHVYHQYTLRSKQRNKIQSALKENGISSVVYYPVPLHLQEALSFLGHGKGSFPVAEQAAEEVLSLPMYPELQDNTIREIAEIINNA
jgi:dTDP-4-amino-4,6-dideoxygalactose transaminase